MKDYMEYILDCDKYGDLADKIGAADLATHLFKCGDIVDELQKERDDEVKKRIVAQQYAECVDNELAKTVEVVRKLGKRNGVCEICGTDCPHAGGPSFSSDPCGEWTWDGIIPDKG